jgi:hypothetical protein
MYIPDSPFWMKVFGLLDDEYIRGFVFYFFYAIAFGVFSIFSIGPWINRKKAKVWSKKFAPLPGRYRASLYCFEGMYNGFVFRVTPHGKTTKRDNWVNTVTVSLLHRSSVFIEMYKVSDAEFFTEVVLCPRIETLDEDFNNRIAVRSFAKGETAKFLSDPEIRNTICSLIECRKTPSALYIDRRNVRLVLRDCIFERITSNETKEILDKLLLIAHKCIAARGMHAK